MQTTNAKRRGPALNSAISGGTIHIRGFDIPYTVVVNPRRKRPYFVMHPDGRLIVECAGDMSDDEITRLLMEEKEWIYREYFCTLPQCPPQTEDQVCRIQNVSIPYRIFRSTRYKRITLKCHGNGTIEVLAPYDTPTSTIAAWVERRSSWIAPRIGLSLQSDQICGHQERGGRSADRIVHELALDGQTIPYTIRRSTRAKRVIIKISRTREVCVVSPPQVPIADIMSFVQAKAAWIARHTIASVHPLPPERRYEDGEVFSCLGEMFTLRIKRGGEEAYELRGDDLIITIPADFTEYHAKDAIKKVISIYYSRRLYQYTMVQARVYATVLGISVPEIKIRDQKTKWGSCTARSIVLNLRLCMAPRAITQYVIAHEIAHKIHPNHSPMFWKTVERLIPDYEHRRRYLKEHGYEWVL